MSRLGLFTSSRIGDLMTVARDKVSFGAPALTYIEEKKIELLIGRTLDKEHSARPTTWGEICELYYFDKKMPITCEVLNETRFKHPKLHWSGAPDGVEGDTIIDIKSPYSLKVFGTVARCNTLEEAIAKHKDVQDYFWQIVSNAILYEAATGTKINKGRLIFFCPTEEEVLEIQELAAHTDLMPSHKIFWIANAVLDELPYLSLTSKISGEKIFEFLITKEAKKRLYDSVKKACEMLDEHDENVNAVNINTEITVDIRSVLISKISASSTIDELLSLISEIPSEHDDLIEMIADKKVELYVLSE